MKTNLILCGVGGQGILSITTVIGHAVMEENMYLKQSEVHGMSQRGGAVQSHLRISSDPIWSDLIPLASAGLILSVEPLEALRYIPWLAPDGWIVTNSQPFINIPDYPPVDSILKHYENLPNTVLLNAEELAAQCGTVKVSNMIMLGAASGFMHLNESSLIKGIEKTFAPKGSKVVEMNLKAFESGCHAAKVLLIEKKK